MSLSTRGKTVILGNSGFVGRALQRHLEQAGVDVRGYSSRTLDLQRPDALSTLDGVLDADTTLIFLAALTPDRGVTLDTLSSNVAMATNVARYLTDRPVRKCVYISSDAVYGAATDPVSEETPAEPGNFYALAKFASERILTYVAAAGGFPLLVLRPVAVYGPGDTHGSYGPNQFVRMIARERMVRLFGEGEEERDHLYLDDLVRIIADLSASDRDGVVNVATGTSRSFGSIVDALRAIVPGELTIVNAPRRAPVTHVHYDVARLNEALPGLTFTPLEEGLRATFASADQATDGVAGPSASPTARSRT